MSLQRKKLEVEGLFGSKGLSSPDFYLHYVMGHGGQPATMKHLMYIFKEGERLLPDAEVFASAAADDCHTIISTALLLSVKYVKLWHRRYAQTC